MDGSPFDFRKSRRLGDGLESGDEQLVLAGGYDHNFVLNYGDGIKARAVEPESGRTLELYTDTPGLQLYTGNFIREGIKGKDGRTYGKRSGFCLETQFFPDSVNRKEFLSPIKNAGEKYDSTTAFRFGTV